MKKVLFISLILCLSNSGCNKTSAETENVSSKKMDSLSSRNDLPSKNVDSIKFTKKDIRHFFSANGGSILYLNNGEVKGEARFDTDGDFLTELLKTDTYDRYKEFDNYLTENRKASNRVEFFEDFGRIFNGWEILKGINVNNPMSVINYKTPKKVKAENIQKISETSLIIFKIEPRYFKDENSQEAQAYFTAMDDYGFYSSELNESFEKLGISTIYLKENNVQLVIENGETMTIDTKKPINNANVSALLYKKGKRPIIIHLVFSDNKPEEIQDYLE